MPRKVAHPVAQRVALPKRGSGEISKEEVMANFMHWMNTSWWAGYLFGIPMGAIIWGRHLRRKGNG